MSKADELDLRKEVENSKVIKAVTDRIDIIYGVALPKKPDNIPAFPSDITSISSENVGQVLSAYDAEIAYIRYLLAVVEAKLDYATSVLDTFKKRLFLTMKNATASIHETNAWVDTNHSVVSAASVLQEMAMEQKLLQARLDIYTKYSASASREISRRRNDSFGHESKMSKSGTEGAQKDRMDKISGKDLKVKK